MLPDRTVTVSNRGSTGLVQAVQWVPRPIAEVFPFFADPRNLERITPPFLNFRILEIDTPEILEGTTIRYRLRVHGLPVGWLTRITAWNPPFEFRDEQVRGPYRHWRHRHLFEAVDGGTRLRDEVRYRAPFDLLRRTPLLGWIDRDVESIFHYRQSVIADIFGGTPATGAVASSSR